MRDGLWWNPLAEQEFCELIAGDYCYPNDGALNEKRLDCCRQLSDRLWDIALSDIDRVISEEAVWREYPRDDGPPLSIYLIQNGDLYAAFSPITFFSTDESPKVWVLCVEHFEHTDRWIELYRWTEEVLWPTVSERIDHEMSS